MRETKCRDFAGEIWKRMKHKKHVNMNDTETRLERCLTLKRLTFIGVGKTVGVGIYVLIGEATIEAGPAIIFSFLIAFLVTLLNGLCFAEYASKNPKTGAQYIYMYETVGEAMAFIVGWTSIIGYVAALSMGSRGWSGYVDSLFNHAISNYTIHHVGNWRKSIGEPFPEYLDIMAICVILFVMIITSVGVNFATALNSLLAFVSGGLLTFIVIVGIVYANTDNWFKQPGGFFPHGMQGVLKASAACFYAFQGFEVLAYSAEETIDPKKNVPRSIITTLVIVTLLYLSVAVSFTLMVPYTAIERSAPFPSAFQHNNISWAKFVVEIGPILALTNLCVLEMYTIQRLTYSMARDGLLFRILSVVNSWSKVPIGPVVAFGPVVIILVICIDLSALISFLVIYTFIQYSVFAAYLIILRYDPSKTRPEISNNDTVATDSDHDISIGCREFLTEFFSVKKLVMILYISLSVLALLVSRRSTQIMSGSLLDVITVILLASTVLAAMLTINNRSQASDTRGFLVPFMPLLPVASIFCNQLMLVSVVDAGSLGASLVLAAVGVFLYMTIVIYNVVKDPNQHSPSDTARLLDNEEEEENEV